MAQALEKADNDLSILCDSVKQLVLKGDYYNCEKIIAAAMSRHPHAPQPHNLMGVLFEARDDHTSAMKHFRAAWSLDPTYYPARHNLDNLASFYIRSEYAFDERDCPAEEINGRRIEYDARGIGHVIKEDLK